MTAFKYRKLRKENVPSSSVYLSGGFYNFFKKNFVAQETIELNISWPSNFFGKYFMAPLINFSFSFKAYL